MPESLLPAIATRLCVSVEELLDDGSRPASDAGPRPSCQQQMDRITQVPRIKQQFVMQVIDSVLAQVAPGEIRAALPPSPPDEPEPFANVLRNEQNTWLSDILLTDFASVQMGAPAVSVAGELTRRKALNCYVLQDKKLMGVIDLPIFLNKVFRE